MSDQTSNGATTHPDATERGRSHANGASPSRRRDRRYEQARLHEAGARPAAKAESEATGCNNPAVSLCHDRFTRGLIRRKARQLARRPEFHEQDRQDLEQELLGRVVQSWSRFDPERGHPKEFVTTVVERRVANLVRDARAQKRDRRDAVSLSARIVVDETPTTLAQTIGQREQDARLERQRRSDEELATLRMDVKEELGKLPERWREMLELRATHTMLEIAEELGVPRTTLNNWMRRTRRLFEDAGLDEYL